MLPLQGLLGSFGPPVETRLDALLPVPPIEVNPFNTLSELEVQAPCIHAEISVRMRSRAIERHNAADNAKSVVSLAVAEPVLF